MSSPSVTAILETMKKERKQAAKSSMIDRLQFMQRFCKLMIDHVVIDFSGSGDSGQIDDIQISYVEGHEPSMAERVTLEEQLRRDLDTWAYKYLEGTGVDWYNNEGGQGQIEFDMRHPPFAFRSNVDINVVSSVTEHECEEIL